MNDDTSVPPETGGGGSTGTGGSLWGPPPNWSGGASSHPPPPPPADQAGGNARTAAPLRAAPAPAPPQEPIEPVAPHSAPATDATQPRSRDIRHGRVIAAVAAAVALAAATVGASALISRSADGSAGGVVVQRPAAPAAPIDTEPTEPGVGDSPATVMPSDISPASESQAADVLRRQAVTDFAELRSQAAEWWVPQLGSKRTGLVADGIVYDDASILEDHLDLRTRFADARLVWAGDWTSFRHPNYWVTVVLIPSATPEAANAWCDNQGFAAEECYAKRLSTVSGYEGNSRFRSDG